MNEQFIIPDDSKEIDPHFLVRLNELGGPKLVAELIAMYFVRGSVLLDTIITGIESEDYEAVKNASHSLISSAGNLGGKHVSELSVALEAAAIEKSAETLNDLKEALIGAQKLFEQYLHGASGQI